MRPHFLLIQQVVGLVEFKENGSGTGMESRNGKDPRKTPDKGHRAIYRLDRFDFATQCFFPALFGFFP